MFAEGLVKVLEGGGEALEICRFTTIYCAITIYLLQK